MAANDGFTTTRWSMVLTARSPSDPGSREALAGLCEAYWYPLYVYVRRHGHDPDQALDLTQGYFLTLLEKKFLEDVRPEAGKFRAFLLASLKHYLSHERRRASARKRGGLHPTLSLDREQAEGRFHREALDDHTPEKAYERQWAMTVLQRANRRLQLELEQAGKREHFRLLSGFLSGDDPGRSYRDVAAELDTTEASVKMAVMRLRRRLGSLLREEIADTVSHESEIDEEVRYLLSVLRDAA